MGNVKCPICSVSLRKITKSHLTRHGLTTEEFLKKHPNVNRGMVPWNKGKTKDTCQKLKRISLNLLQQKEWNFSNWQRKRREALKEFKAEEISKSNEYAELIGIILGDGCVTAFPRTEALRITCNSEQRGYITHIAALMQRIFNKKPSVHKRKNQNTTDVVLYKNRLSEILQISCGNKIKNGVSVPSWIKSRNSYAIQCLKGLFETDGCFHEDSANYTCVMEFKNVCRNLLQDVYWMLKRFGYHPQIGKVYVRLARKKEAYSFKDLISFRTY